MEQLKKLPYSSVVGALQYQSETRPNKRAILYPDPNENFTKYASLTYREYNNITNHLAEEILNHFPSLSSNERITCALLGNGGIEYLLSEYALLKIPNAIVFPISIRNSQSGLEHLLKETETKLLLTTSLYLPMIQIIQQELKDFKVLLLDSELFHIKNLLKYKDNNSSNISNRKTGEELNQIVVILHSSGSTAHPKIIHLTNRYLLIGFTMHLSINKRYWEENDVVLIWGALFHSLAFNSIVRSIVIGLTLALPLCVTFPPKPNELLRNILVDDGITTLFTVPSLLEQLVRELIIEKNAQIGFQPLQKLKFVMYSGAGCAEELCRILVDNGVRLLSLYGATEANGILMKNFDPYDKRWKIMQIPPVRKEFLRFEKSPNSQNTNEQILIHLPNDPFLAENISNSPDGTFTSGDLFLEDPPNSGQYLLLGRQDNTLVHINGEKTNPLPMEETIRLSPFVQQVAIVGQDHFCTAAIIQLNIQQTFDFTSKQIEENIWKIVQQANRDAPSHSKILRELIYILPNDQILPITDKGTLMRLKTNQIYSTIIDEIYFKFSNVKYHKQTNEQIKWTKESINKYLHDKFNSIGKDLNDYSRSIFDYGVNSLEVIQLRNIICEDICQIPKNFLYEYSSLDQIVEQLFKYLQGQSIPDEENDPSHYTSTEQILDEFVHLIKENPFSSNEQKNRGESERVYFLTGANGSLGNFILRDLLQQPIEIVKCVFCLLRGSNPQERLFQSFEQRQLDSAILNKSLQNHRLIILSESINLTEEYLGLSSETYHRLEDEVTDVIHSAWKMNFNQSVKDFRDDTILGLYHLLKFCRKSRIQFHFVSSISSGGSGLLNPVKEEPLPRDPQVALPQGYGQSKYIGEHLCLRAKEDWNIPMKIYRVGQVSGDTENGVWNKSELAAMMIYAGAGQIHQMPNIGQDINWIPVNICSYALVHLSFNSSDHDVYHLVNPHSLSYQEYLQALHQAGFNFQSVSPKEFLDSILNNSDLSNPLIKLSSFLEQRFFNKQKSKFPTFLTEKTAEKCDILKNCPRIDSNLIELYANYWKKS